MSGGYNAERAVFLDECVILGDVVVHTHWGGLDEKPAGVSEVRLIELNTVTNQSEDGARIVIPPGSATPVQRFSSEIPREFIEEPIGGDGVWVGISPDGSSYVYIPATTHSMVTRRREGSLRYGSGWTQCWINNGEKELVYGEWCRPAFNKFGTTGIEILNVGDNVGAPMFWGLYRLLRDESLRRADSPQA